MRPTVLHTTSAALCLCLSACSLLFESSPPATGATDAGLDAASTPDAFTRECGISLEGTIGYFPLDGESGEEVLIDRVSNRFASSVTRTSDNTLVSEGLNTKEGPTPECGVSAALSGTTGTFVQIGRNEFRGTKAMDFWFQVDSIPNNGVRGGLLTKDRATGNEGDLAIFLVAEKPSSPMYRLLLRLQDDEANTYFSCTELIELQGQWNHVAVSLDGTEGATMYLNGELADSTDEFNIPQFGTAFCGVRNPAHTVTLENNDQEWMWGAAGYSANNNLARDAVNGAVDELRFRDQTFTASEALEVYNSLPVGN